jgi:hypothetical protein
MKGEPHQAGNGVIDRLYNGRSTKIGCRRICPKNPIQVIAIPLALHKANILVASLNDRCLARNMLVVYMPNGMSIYAIGRNRQIDIPPAIPCMLSFFTREYMRFRYISAVAKTIFAVE